MTGGDLTYETVSGKQDVKRTSAALWHRSANGHQPWRRDKCQAEKERTVFGNIKTRMKWKPSPGTPARTLAQVSKSCPPRCPIRHAAALLSARPTITLSPRSRHRNQQPDRNAASLRDYVAGPSEAVADRTVGRCRGRLQACHPAGP